MFATAIVGSSLHRWFSRGLQSVGDAEVIGGGLCVSADMTVLGPAGGHWLKSKCWDVGAQLTPGVIYATNLNTTYTDLAEVYFSKNKNFCRFDCRA